jgi:hypothetical protein
VAELRRDVGLLEPHLAELAVGVLAVETPAVFTIYLRQRGSPESKPVCSAHETTGASG